MLRQQQNAKCSSGLPTNSVNGKHIMKTTMIAFLFLTSCKSPERAPIVPQSAPPIVISIRGDVRGDARGDAFQREDLPILEQYIGRDEERNSRPYYRYEK